MWEYRDFPLSSNKFIFYLLHRLSDTSLLEARPHKTAGKACIQTLSKRKLEAELILGATAARSAQMVQNAPLFFVIEGNPLMSCTCFLSSIVI